MNLTHFSVQNLCHSGESQLLILPLETQCIPTNFIFSPPAHYVLALRSCRPYQGAPSCPHQVHVRLHTFFQQPKMVTWPYHISTGKPQLLDTTDASRVPGGVMSAMVLLAAAAIAGTGETCFAFIICSTVSQTKTKDCMCTHLDSGSYHHLDDCS